MSFSELPIDVDALAAYDDWASGIDFDTIDIGTKQMDVAEGDIYGPIGTSQIEVGEGDIYGPVGTSTGSEMLGPPASAAAGGAASTATSSLWKTLGDGVKAGAKALNGATKSSANGGNDLTRSLLSQFPRTSGNSMSTMSAAPAGRGDGGAKTVGADAVAAWVRIFSAGRRRSDD